MRKIILSLLFLALLPCFLLAQETFKIKGKVTDSKTGEPLIGASVVLRPSNIGAAVDLDGNYSFDVPMSFANKQQAELTASLINYKKKTVKVTLDGKNITQNFAMVEDIFQSEEIVVTGIASKTSKSVAEVAVARIAVSELTDKQNYQSLSQLLSGKVAGVNVNFASGNVGSGWTFLVRGGGGINGSGQPLIYVDGVRIENLSLDAFNVGGQSISSLSTLNPNDIENIEVLKGPAAAAMYGTNASNGVVLITTKSGKLKIGGKKDYSVQYQYNFGMNTQLLTIPTTFANADTMNNILDVPGYIREHTFSISGGTNTIRYFTSFQNRFEQGLIPSQNLMDRSVLKVNISAVPSDQLSLKFSTAFTRSNLRRPRNDNSSNGWGLNALAYWPAFVTTKRVSIEAFEDKNLFNTFIGSAALTWNPLNNFEINGGGGVNYNQFEQNQLEPYGFQYGSRTTGQRSLYKREGIQMTYDLNARYSFKNLLIDNFNFSTIVGTQIVTRTTKSSSIEVQGFSHSSISDIASATTVLSRGDSFGERREAGIYVDVPFTYNNIYFWTLGLRRDYSSAVGKRSPAITYPHASFAVRLDNFDILPSEISLLKLRAGYGESGQLPSNTDGLAEGYAFDIGGSGLSGLAVSTIGNPQIEPERIKEYEVGFDVEFLKMFSLEFTYYTQQATKSIVNATLPPSKGLGDFLFPYNVGSITNKGFESLLQINPIRSNDYDLSLSFIWNYQNNKVESLGEEIGELQAGRLTVIKPGLPKFQFYDFKVLGAKFKADGTYDGPIVSTDKYDYGSPFPDHSGSIAVNFRFLKNFVFNCLAQWGLNNKVLSYTIRRAALANSYMPYVELKTKLGITYTGPQVTNVTKLTPGTPEYIEAADKYAKMNPNVYGNYIYDADFFILREASLSYNFTELLSDFLPGNIVSGLHAGISVRNLFKLSKYELDAEANFAGGSGGTSLADTGTDWATLQNPRTYNFWLRFEF